MTAVFLLLLAESDYIKKRREVDKDWLIGKSIWMIGLKYYVEEKNDPAQCYEEYDYCVREVVWGDWLDGMEGGYKYYLRMEDGKVAEVTYFEYGLDVPAENYRYEDRW